MKCAGCYLRSSSCRRRGAVALLTGRAGHGCVDVRSMICGANNKAVCVRSAVPTFIPPSGAVLGEEGPTQAEAPFLVLCSGRRYGVTDSASKRVSFRRRLAATRVAKVSGPSQNRQVRQNRRSG